MMLRSLGALGGTLAVLLFAGQATADQCTLIGAYEGSEDVTIYQNGLLFITSGLVTSTTQNGTMLCLDMESESESGTPELHEMTINFMPESYAFRPHGMYIDNSTSRAFVVSHGDRNEEESIAVFNIIAAEGGGRIPALDFAFALVSENIPYHNQSKSWFLNDVVVATRGDGATQELYSTQLGPRGETDEFWLWRCTWDEENGEIVDGRLQADCGTVPGTASPSGLNGVTIATDGTRLWVNQRWTSTVRAYTRDAGTGGLARDADADIHLPNPADNLEYDWGSGDITVGDIGTMDTDPFAYHHNGGLLTVTASTGNLQLETGFREKASEAMAEFVVSSSVLYGDWVVIGSAFDTGLAVCRLSHRAKEEL